MLDEPSVLFIEVVDNVVTTPTEAVVIVVRVRPIGERKHVPILVGIQRVGFRRASICIIYCPVGPVSDAL
ncbi:hypothetical protein Y032_0017g3211 [Ancylostoma ceylanicum]|uniref:Uncharacterized protein n=1 Tax=Ancylostoma ceylanicum TaxID=53326 RepID=A0A016V4M2_9BILA|nr:hypothetical protein Y032_0017g3211 [Ancylostoma ceylanicum]